MKKIINFEDFNLINWFNSFTEIEIKTIKDRFLNFPEDKYINLYSFQFDLFEYSDCDDYHYLVNKLLKVVLNRYPDFEVEMVTCLKKNKIELLVKGKKYKKAFRVNGSRFDIENLLDFLNGILNVNNIEENFYLLDSSSDIQYPILIKPELLELAKEKALIAVK
jgi:hypothetical protein